ncbi:MAG: DUF6279 family lipoprotein [Burkholderiaceae bacterium]
MSVPSSRPGLWKRIIGLLGVLSALLLLPGCSAVKLAYNNLPELGYWWVDGYADLGEAQSLRVREDLGRLQRWHRTAELPRIAELLQKMQRLAPNDATTEQVCALFADVRTRFDASTAQAEPAAVSLAMSLSAPQLAHMEGKYAKANVEWRDEWGKGTDTDRQARRLKASIERSEQFYGTLEERQIAVLRNAIARSDFDPQLSYTERLRRQQDLLQTLRAISSASPTPRPSAAQATGALRAYLDRSFNSPNPSYRAYAERAIQDSCRMVAEVHNATSPEQRERAARRLAAYERDARELAVQR